MKVGFWDIETTSLNATFGHLLCSCIKVIGEDETRDAIVWRLSDERRALEQMEEQLEDVDMIVSWNGLRFDSRIIKARRIFHKLPPPRTKFHLDLLQHHRSHFRTGGHRLDGVLRELEIPVQKFHVPAKAWQTAQDPTDPDFRLALTDIVKHCQHDVMCLEHLYNLILPYVKTISRR